MAQRLYERAEKAYRQALESNPQQVPTLLNLADLYRVLERDVEARAVLNTAITSAPAQAAPHHALGLLETRRRQPGGRAFDILSARRRWKQKASVTDTSTP